MTPDQIYRELKRVEDEGLLLTFRKKKRILSDPRVLNGELSVQDAAFSLIVEKEKEPVKEESLPELQTGGSLPKYQEGGKVNPLKISDKKEFEYREKMYNDSLAAYNEGMTALQTHLGNNPDVMGYTTEDFLKEEGRHIHTPSASVFGRYGLDVNVLDEQEKANSLYYGFSEPHGNSEIYPSVSLEFLGGIGGIDLFNKPKQPVEYQKPTRPSYQQIPVKTPTVLPVQQANEKALQQSFVEPITKYPKDIRRYTAAKYLESQGRPTGYVNYGKGEGRRVF